MIGPDNVQTSINNLSTLVIQMAVSSGIGYFFGHLFKVVDPKHAAVFCAVAVPVSAIVELVTNQIFNRQGASSEAKLVGKIVSFVITTAISVALATALGFTITMNAGLVLFAALVMGWYLTAVMLDRFDHRRHGRLV